MIKFKCPHCGKEVSVGDEHAGKKGRCPGCKELFVIPAAKSAKPAPSVERRTLPADGDEEDAPPKKKKYEEDDLEVVEEPKNRAGAKSAKRRPDEDDEEAIAEAPRKKRPSRDDEDDEAIADSPRKKRLASRDDDDEDDDRPRKKRGRDEDDDEDDRPRKKRKKRRGQYADCPSCGCRGDATMVGFTWWGGIIGPRLFSHVRCNRCGNCYNGKTGESNTTKIAIYVGVGFAIGVGLVIVGVILQSQR